MNRCAIWFTCCFVKCGNVFVETLATGEIARTRWAEERLDMGVLDRMRNQTKRVVQYDSADVAEKPETTIDGTGASIGPPHRSHALLDEAVVSISNCAKLAHPRPCSQSSQRTLSTVIAATPLDCTWRNSEETTSISCVTAPQHTALIGLAHVVDCLPR
jgi:hypothetical protein